MNNVGNDISKNKNKRFANKYDGFLKRLELCKVNNNFESDGAFSRWLGINPNAYSMICRNTRPISDNFLDKLILATNKPEEYWLHGIDENSDEYLYSRSEFKSLVRAIKVLIDNNLIENDGTYASEENKAASEKILNAALTTDLVHLVIKINNQKH